MARVAFRLRIKAGAEEDTIAITKVYGRNYWRN